MKGFYRQRGAKQGRRYQSAVSGQVVFLQGKAGVYLADELTSVDQPISDGLVTGSMPVRG